AARVRAVLGLRSQPRPYGQETTRKQHHAQPAIGPAPGRLESPEDGLSQGRRRRGPALDAGSRGLKQKQPRVVEFRLVLAAVEPPLADAWERLCGDVEFVTVHRGSILDVSRNAVVSPATAMASCTAALTANTWITWGPTSNFVSVVRSTTDHAS